MTPPDCKTCGACCAGGYAHDHHADCTTADVVRMSRAARARLVDGRHRPITEPQPAHTPTDGDGRCVFLRGTVGRRASCRIYETRPAVCRDFKPGSQRCKDARYGMEIAP